MAVSLSNKHQLVKLSKLLQVTLLLRNIHKGVDLVRTPMAVVITHSNEIHPETGLAVLIHVEMVLTTTTITGADVIKTVEVMIGIPIVEVSMVETTICSSQEFLQG